LARRAYANIAPDLQAQQDADVRSLGQSAAKFGRVGSGLVNTQLADLGTEYNKRRQSTLEDLALKAADQQLSDRLATTSATGSGLGQLAGLDTTKGTYDLGRETTMNQMDQAAQLANAQNKLATGTANASILAQLFGQNKANQDTAIQRERDINQLGFDKASALTQLGGINYGRADTERQLAQSQEAQAYNQNAGYRNELRGERGYQDSLNSDAMNQALQQFLTESGQQQQNYTNNQNQAGNLWGIGASGNPTGQLNYQGQNLQNQGADTQAGLDAFLQEMARQRAGQNPVGYLPPEGPVDASQYSQYLNPTLPSYLPTTYDQYGNPVRNR
jgi:hypothetical protein